MFVSKRERDDRVPSQQDTVQMVSQSAVYVSAVEPCTKAGRVCNEKVNYQVSLYEVQFGTNISTHK